MNLRNITSVKERRTIVESELNVSLPNIGAFSLDEEAASKKNCENMIGVAQIPLGIAGPLKLISGNVGSKPSQSEEYYLPLATTEGALIASINRGCKAIYESGGAFVAVERVGITRGPVFKTSSLLESFSLRDWIEQHEKEIAECANLTSSHLTYISSKIQIAGNLVFVRFSFDTQDAMGMNMATIASQAIVEPHFFEN